MATGATTAAMSQVIGIDCLIVLMHKVARPDRIGVESKKGEESGSNLSTDAYGQSPASSQRPISIISSKVHVSTSFIKPALL